MVKIMLGFREFGRDIERICVDENRGKTNLYPREESRIEPIDISFIERTSPEALSAMFDQYKSTTEDKSKATNFYPKQIKEETGWSDEIIECINNMDQYEVLKRAGLVETELNGRKCLVKENVYPDYIDEVYGITNRERMSMGLPPLDNKTGQPIELVRLNRKTDSPRVELTKEEYISFIGIRI